MASEGHHAHQTPEVHATGLSTLGTSLPAGDIPVARKEEGLRLRLALLLALLCLAIGGWRYVDRTVAPDFRTRRVVTDGPPRPLSEADKEKLKVLQIEFMKERDEYLKLKNANAPSAQVDAQYQRVADAVQAVQEIGGTDAIRTLPRSKYAPTSKPGGNKSGAGPGGSQGGR